LADRLSTELGFEIVFLDLGTVEVDVFDGAARLISTLEIRVL
jgi:hypothetical protein